MTQPEPRATDGGSAGWVAPTPTERLRDYLKVARRRWTVIVSITVLVVVVAVAVSATGTKQYDATAKLLFQSNESINNLLNDSSSSNSTDPERDANTKLGLIKLETVADRVRERLRLEISVSQLLDKVNTEVEGNSDIVAVTSRDPSSKRAAAIANAFADEYVAFRQRSARSTLQEAARLAKSRLDSLSPEDRISTQGRALEARLRELEINSALQTGGAEVVRRASPPSSPATPRPMLSGVLGGMLGLLLALIVVLILEFADRRIRETEDAQALFGLPVLAQIPRPPRGSAGSLTDGDRAQDEAYSSLAANLLFATRGRAIESLMVMSPGPGDGKTMVTLRLARALALLGKSVIAVEGDLRRPRFAERIHVGTRSGGLAAVLVGGSEVRDELLQIDVVSMMSTEGPPELGTSLSLLPAGPSMSAAQVLLSHPGMGQILEECRSLADFVLVDTPPIAVVHDAITLVNGVDAALMVSRLGWTTKDACRTAVRVLRPLDLRMLGLVLTGTVRPEGDYYGDASEERMKVTAEALKLARPL